MELMDVDVKQFVSKILFLQLVLYCGIHHSKRYVVQHYIHSRTDSASCSDVCHHVSFS
jgi:hypothetical protein